MASDTLHGWIKPLLEAIRFLNGNLIAKSGIPPCALSIWVASEAPETVQAVTTAHGYPSGLDGKTLLLKLPHTLDVEYRETNQDLN